MLKINALHSHCLISEVLLIIIISFSIIISLSIIIRFSIMSLVTVQYLNYPF